MSFGRWVIGTADSVCRVSEGIDRAESLGRRGFGGARDVVVGAEQVRQIGADGRRRIASRSSSGSDDAGLHHGDDDREEAVLRLDRWFGEFRRDVEPRASAPGTPPHLAQWWRVDVLPVLSDWGAFRTHQSTWSARLATEWSTYVAWLKQLRILRQEARISGFLLASPEPTRLPETAFERGALGTGSRIETAWTIGKVLVYTAVGVAGAASLWAIYRELRSPTSSQEVREERET